LYIEGGIDALYSLGYKGEAMRIIGVTGPTGSGKTVLTEYFSDLGVPTIDADELYHSMLIPPSPCLDAIREVFGDIVIAEDGSLDRVALSGIVFNSHDKLELLNSTVLGIVIEKIREIISKFESEGHTTVVVDAPTLIESGFHKECDVMVTVIAPLEDRVLRISARDGIDEQRARERVSAQKPDSFYTDPADIVIINDRDDKQYLEKIKQLAKDLGYTEVRG
jgi:dephospho-CoA kinase